MHILIAPNAFKNSLDAEAAARAIQQGLNQSSLMCTTECFPIADGGDGTGKLIVKKRDGIFVNANVYDPLGKKIKASFGLIDQGDTAIIEMADASGLRLLNPGKLLPLRASSFGTGELMKEALDKGAKKIIIAMGGSATVDGGCGILNAMGIQFLDPAGQPLKATPETLLNLAAVDLSGLDQRVLQTELVILCDVTISLLGKHGAAAVFGPQKGASPADVQKLETFLTRFSDTASQHTGKDISQVKHGGTAGGAAAGLFAFLNAKLVNGIDYFLELTDFDSALKRSDLLITGEGSMDEQTMQGKGPFGVACKAKLKGVPVIALAGKIPDGKNENLLTYFNELIAISDKSVDLATALRNTAGNLEESSLKLGNRLALK
jgi:glycerate kinase